MYYYTGRINQASGHQYNAYLQCQTFPYLGSQTFRANSVDFIGTGDLAQSGESRNMQVIGHGLQKGIDNIWKKSFTI